MKQKINIKNDIFLLDKVSVVIYNHIRSETEGGARVATNLREIRKQRGLTQNQLAEKSGVARINIARYESGEVIPGALNLMKLAEALECNAEEILGRKAG